MRLSIKIEDNPLQEQITQYISNKQDYKRFQEIKNDKNKL